MLDVCLLGTGGTMPVFDRFFSACLLRYQGRLMLIDCGEGTQMTARRLGWGFKAIDVILLTHLHADHVSGLPGILHSIATAGRTEPLFIFGPPGTAQVVTGLRVVAPVLPYEVACVELESMQTELWEGLELAATPLRHSVPCLAWRIDIPRSRQFQPERAKELGVPQHLWRALQQGEAIDLAGRRILPGEVLGPDRRGIRFAFVTDTLPVPELADFVAKADLLICEGMYGLPEETPPLEERWHLSFTEAATLARDAGVDQLWLTHFSPALPHPEQALPIAQAIFPGASLGYERRTTLLRFRDELPAAS